MLLAIDTEVTGIDLSHGAQPYIVTTCDEDNTQETWIADVDPLTRMPLWSNDDLDQIAEKVLGASETVFQNPNFDVRALDNIIPGFSKQLDWSTVYDTLLADHLVKSNRRHDLTTQTLVYLRKNIKRYEDAVEHATKEARRRIKSLYPKWMMAKKDLMDEYEKHVMPSAKESVWKMDMWAPRAFAIAQNYPEDHLWYYVTQEYADIDSLVTLHIFLSQKKYLEENDLWEIYLERLKVLPKRHAMETGGITANEDRLNELDQEYKTESSEANEICKTIAESYYHAGVSDAPYQLSLPKNGMNKNLGEFVFNVMKLPVVKTTDKGNPSLDKYAIEEYLATLPAKSREYAFIATLAGKRSRDTAIGYMASYRKYWHQLQGPWRRLHPSLNPTGTDTLRWSSQGPNEQQISKKEGFNLRYAFGPLPGREWWSLDYQNIELRIPAYESNERVMIDLFEKPDEAPYFGSNHLFNASIVYPELFWPLADKKGAFKKQYASTYYQWIKNFGFAVQYGAVERVGGTADKAAHRDGAHAKVMARLKEADSLNHKYIDLANLHGYVETIPDVEVNPRRGYPLWCPKGDRGKVIETIPLNYHVQGTACWVMMRAMDKVQTYLDTITDSRIALQIHDELVIDMPYVPNMGNLPKIRRIQLIMESLGECISVPLTTGIEYHQHNWAEGKSVI